MCIRVLNFFFVQFNHKSRDDRSFEDRRSSERRELTERNWHDKPDQRTVSTLFHSFRENAYSPPGVRRSVKAVIVL